MIECENKINQCLSAGISIRENQSKKNHKQLCVSQTHLGNEATSNHLDLLNKYSAGEDESVSEDFPR